MTSSAATTIDVIVLSISALLGTVGVAVTGFGMAIVYLFVWQIMVLILSQTNGDDDDSKSSNFKYAIFIQALALFSAQPLLLYKAQIFKFASKSMLLYFIPITILSTPIGQVVGDIISTDLIEAIGGILVTFVAVLEMYQKRNLFASWLGCTKADAGDDKHPVETVKEKDDLESHQSRPPMVGASSLINSDQVKESVNTIEANNSDSDGTNEQQPGEDEEERNKDTTANGEKVKDEVVTSSSPPSTSSSSSIAMFNMTPALLSESFSANQFKDVVMLIEEEETEGIEVNHEGGARENVEDDSSETRKTDRETGGTDTTITTASRTSQPSSSSSSSTTATTIPRLSYETQFWTLLAGFTSGFLGGLCGIRGPPIIIYFLHPPKEIRLNKQTQRATGACITATNVSMRVIYLLVETFLLKDNNKEDEEIVDEMEEIDEDVTSSSTATNTFIREDWYLYLSIILCSTLGVWIGSELFKLLADNKDTIRGILSIFLLLCGISLLLSSFANL